jgi:hypothetical protein
MEYIIRNILTEEEWNNLNIKAFQGDIHKARTDKFVDYLQSQTPIPIKKGEPIVVNSVSIKKDGSETSYDPTTQAAELKTILPTLTSGDKLYLLYQEGKKHSITTVAKTKELGGKGKGGLLKPERSAIASLQSQLAEIKKPISIVIGGKKYDNIDGIANVKENQKADFAFTSNGTPTVFLSYKPGNSAKDIISYGGITKTSAESEEVAAFIKAVQKKTSDMEGLGTEYGIPLTDDMVAIKTIYGINSGSDDFNINNVQALVQGTSLKLTLVKDNIYNLDASTILTSPSIPSGDYAPWLNARYANDRHQFGVKHCRFGVVPMGARRRVESPFKKD